jgi:copper(I)-binding protein
VIGRLQRVVLACVAVLAAVTAGAADAPRVTDAWARATPPGAPFGAVYLRIEGGAVADRLLAATTPRSQRVELHTSVASGGMTGMRAVSVLGIPAGGHVQLVPQGLHLMLIGLTGPLRAGETLPLALRFEHGGDVSVEVHVRAPTADHETTAPD